MVEPIYCLKPAWCGRHLAGLRPETGLTVRYGATAFKAVGCHFPDEGSALKLPGFNAVISRMDVFALRQCPIAVHSKCLLGGQGSAGTRPEHRCKSGMDGGFTAAILINPPLYLRTLDFLSKRWGPPQPRDSALSRSWSIVLHLAASARA